jgi:hypothetical protein
MQHRSEISESVVADGPNRRDIMKGVVIPDKITCRVCRHIVKDPVHVLWDVISRPVCKSCMRDGILIKGKGCCPLTGRVDVNQERLFPNEELREASESFVVNRQVELNDEGLSFLMILGNSFLSTDESSTKALIWMLQLIGGENWVLALKTTHKSRRCESSMPSLCKICLQEP